MQTTRSRLGRLEQAMPSGPKRLAFLVYGRTDIEREGAIEAAIFAGTIRSGDVVIRGDWTRPDDPPCPRWIEEGSDVRSDLDRLSAQLVEAAGSGKDEPRTNDRKLLSMSAVELLAAALGKPLAA